MDLTGIPVPKMDWEASNLPEEFRKFKQHVELIVNGPLKDKEEGVKCTYFMLWIGDRGREIFNTWSVSSADAKVLNTYYTKFQAYVQPKLNPIFARYKFNNEMQKDQSIEQFVTKLKILGKDCKFQDVDELVRDRIVFGTSHNKVREMLINEGEQLNLDKAVQIAQQYEYAQLQLKSMTPITATAFTDVNTVTEAGYGTKAKAIPAGINIISQVRYSEDGMVPHQILHLHQIVINVQSVDMDTTRQVNVQLKENAAISATDGTILQICAPAIFVLMLSTPKHVKVSMSLSQSRLL
ncbi:hypothetical protein GQR58_026725 [Nymphon striatum]|nr:hypothetical protein GQR58_026725 [Nymphon striatum]